MATKRRVPGPTTSPSAGVETNQASGPSAKSEGPGPSGLRTVTAIRGDEVTFSVRTRYRGPAIADPTLVATGMTGTSITPGGGPTLTVGKRYLVAGEDRFVWGCGYTQPYDPAVAADWAAALR